MRNIKYVFMTILLFSLISVPLAMQAHSFDGALISGRICSPDRCGIPGVSITLIEEASGQTTRLVTGLGGIYRAAGLPVGTYELRVEASGFDPEIVPDIDLTEGESRIIDITLSYSTIQEVVTVIGEAPRGALQATEARESAARDVGEALTRINGVSKVRKGGIANDIVLRGFASKDMNILIDGQKLYGACPNHMDPTAFHVDFSEVDRVEITKGPFDIRNQGSMGGAINVVTRNSEQGLHATATFAGGTYGFANPSATVSYAHSRFSVLGGFSYRRSLPYSDPSGKQFTDYTNYRPGTGENEAFRASTGWAKLSFTPRSNHFLQLAYTRQEAEHVLYPYLMMDADYDDTDRINLSYQIAPSFGFWKSLQLQTYYSHVSHWMTDAFRVSSVNFPRDYSMGTYAATSVIGAKIEAETTRWTLGLEAYDRSWRAETELAGMGYKTQYSIPDVSTASFGVFADYRQDITERLKLAAGVRLDFVRSKANGQQANTDLYFAYNSTRSTESSDFFPSVYTQFVYLFPAGLELQLGLGHIVRVPDARERYFALKRMGADWVGNPALDPSRNTGLDGAVSYRTSALLLSASFYYNDIQNYVYVRNKSKVNPVAGLKNIKARSYQNIDARIYGSELQAVITVSKKLSFSTSLSYVRGTQPIIPEEGLLSGNLAEIPPLTSRSVLRFDNGLVWGEVEGIFTGAQNKVDANLLEEPTPGHELANLRIGINLKKVRFWLGMNNVFNRLFFEHLSYQRDPFRSGVRVYEPGRNFFLNADFKF